MDSIPQLATIDQASCSLRVEIYLWAFPYFAARTLICKDAPRAYGPLLTALL